MDVVIDTADGQAFCCCPSPPRPLRRLRVYTVLLTWLLGALALGVNANPRPENDDFAQAIVMLGDTFTLTGITADASTEIGTNGLMEVVGPLRAEGLDCFNFFDPAQTKSLWWRWRAPTNGTVFLLQSRYTGVDPFCSPVLSVWRVRDIKDPAFPFVDPYNPPLLPVTASGSRAGSPRYPYTTFDAQAGEEFVFQMIGNSREPHSVHVALRSTPSILEEPVGRSAQAGESILLTVVAIGARKEEQFSGPVVLPGCSYQWYFNHQPLEGEVYSTLAIPQFTSKETGVYQVNVSDKNGTIWSREVTLSLQSQPEPPRLEISTAQDDQPPLFTLRGEPGRIYQLEISTDLNQWSQPHVEAMDGVESDDRYVSLYAEADRDKVAIHGSPFRFRLPGLPEKAFVRARTWEATCRECMLQLWLVQFAKEDWARENRERGTTAVLGPFIFDAYAQRRWANAAGPTNSLCNPMPIILNSVLYRASWPCVLWPGADGSLVVTQELPWGVWNGARTTSPQ